MPESVRQSDPVEASSFTGRVSGTGRGGGTRTAELLAERGVASVAPGLPSCGETGKAPDAQGPGLTEDIAAAREVLTACRLAARVRGQGGQRRGARCCHHPFLSQPAAV